jgi:hypothetical protein
MIKEIVDKNHRIKKQPVNNFQRKRHYQNGNFHASWRPRNILKITLVSPTQVRNNVSVAAVTSDCQLQPVTTPK